MKSFISGLFMLLALASFGSLTACNTVEGAGRDVEKAGEGIQDASDPNERDER